MCAIKMRVQLIVGLLAIVIVACEAQHHQQCPPRCICFRTTVRCMFQQLDRIPDVSPDTTILDLRFNRIRDIPSHAFQHLVHLNTLLLNNNHIARLHGAVFHGLGELKYLYLYKNRLRHIDSRVFQGLPKLEQLYLHFNELVDIHPNTFAQLPSLERLFLHNNKLERIPYGAFKNMSALRRLRLDSNALVCDCGMAWLVEMLQSSAAHTQTAATCQQPVSMQGRSLTALSPGDLHCDKPRIVEDPHDVEVSFGGTAIFTCKAEGDPKPNIVWMRDSNEVNLQDPRVSQLSDGSLRIDNALQADVGSYECMARNEAGEVKSRRATMSAQPTNSKPYFRRTPLDQDTEVGGTVSLNCAATGQPSPDITWTRDDLPLVSQRFEVSTSPSSLNTLTISNIQREDAGVYKCSASNFVGRVAAVAQVTVNVAPSFTTEPENLVLKSGASGVLRCAATGAPTPDITWHKDGRLVAPGNRVTFNRGHVTLNHVKEADGGLYTCRAENSRGIKEASARVTVLSITGYDLPSVLVPAATVGPRLVVSPYDMEAPKGSTIELPCKAEGEPKPAVTWTKDRVALVTTSRLRIGTYNSVYITQLSESDAGVYECVATNSRGTARASGRLSIKDVVMSPGDRFVRIAFQEATASIDKAVNETINKLFVNPNHEQRNHGELFRQIRFPNAQARSVARAANIYERTLSNIRRHVEAGMSVNLTADFSYKQLLSPTHLALVANLSGCQVHRASNNCSDICFHSKYRSLDGTCNNLQHPMWGASLTGFRRIIKPAYEDGLGLPMGWRKHVKYHGYVKPSARLISTSVISTEEVTQDSQITHMVMQWGQFLDHDLDHALPSVSGESWDGIDCKKTCDYAPPCYPIEIPPNDPRVKNRRCIDFVRSSAVCGSGHTSVFFDNIAPREQINQLTSFIDASQVYGFSEEVARDLRDLTSDLGLLRVGVRLPNQKPLLPLADSQPNDCRRDPLESDVGCFLAGDIRANEQLGLLAMHTIWFREHNRIATELKLINPTWDGNTLYQEARKIVGAEIQHITYTQWLPTILGARGMEMLGSYRGYDANLDPSISNVFASAALRFGHSLINPVLSRLNQSYHTIPQGDISLGKAFFSPWRLVEEGGVDPLLRGLYARPAKLKLPTQSLNRQLTEHLFEVAHAVALDLAAINIQRGRDHGIPGYNAWRKICNLSEAENFSQLHGISSREVRDKLEQMYGHPGNIDVWVGGILEDVEPGAKVGPLFQCLLVEQFKRLRDGDRFWYENPSVFKPEQLSQIKQASLARALCDNGDDIKDVSSDVFLLPKLQSPAYSSCVDIPVVDLRMWTHCCNSIDCSQTEQPNSLSGFRSRRSINLDDEAKEEDEEEERIEGIESVLESFQKTMKQLRRKIRKLEQHCHSNRCMDKSHRWREQSEKWHPDKCTSCICKEKQISCEKITCPHLDCKLKTLDQECCPTCAD